MKRYTFLLAFMLTSICVYASDPPAWPSGPVAVLPRGEYILSEDTTLAYDQLTLSAGATITTSGHNLELHIREELTINANVVIRSFSPSQVPPIPPQAPKGPPGKSHDRGPMTEGAGVAEKGDDGETGKPGETGTTGERGYDAGIITVRLEPGVRVSGNLVIHNVGGSGGTGGQGGPGGTGGDGQQGGRGRPNPVFPPDCQDGPGWGGRAGDGGPGGPAGRGGDGGDGGLILLQAGSKETREWFDSADLRLNGGQPGQPGKGGEGGNPGEPGFGGRGAGGCQGKEADRMGPRGYKGNTGDETSAHTGARQGRPGQIKIL